MKKLLLVLAIVLPIITGCSRRYVLVLNNGAQLSAPSKPVLQGGSYVFKDNSGREVRVPQGRVREVAPASRVAKEKQAFKPTPSR